MSTQKKKKTVTHTPLSKPYSAELIGYWFIEKQWLLTVNITFQPGTDRDTWAPRAR